MRSIIDTRSSDGDYLGPFPLDVAGNAPPAVDEQARVGGREQGVDERFLLPELAAPNLRVLLSFERSSHDDASK